MTLTEETAYKKFLEHLAYFLVLKLIFQNLIKSENPPG